MLILLIRVFHYYIWIDFLRVKLIIKIKNVMKTIKDYFRIEELVDKAVYDIHKENSWKFIDKDILSCLLVIREGIGKPITVNTWIFGGTLSQRGLRHNMSSLVKKKTRVYLSAHMFGKALDFDVEGMTAVEVREWINNNTNLFPCKIRLERNINGKPISWVHLDIMADIDQEEQVYSFDI